MTRILVLGLAASLVASNPALAAEHSAAFERANTAWIDCAAAAIATATDSVHAMDVVHECHHEADHLVRMCMVEYNRGDKWCKRTILEGVRDGMAFVRERR